MGPSLAYRLSVLRSRPRRPSGRGGRRRGSSAHASRPWRAARPADAAADVTDAQAWREAESSYGPAADHPLVRIARGAYEEGEIRILELVDAYRTALKAIVDIDHPLLVHLIVTRRCNLACGYCTEYGGVSAAVPLAQLARRVDRIADLGTAIVTVSGGEPMLHPHLEQVIARIRIRGMSATLITNGYGRRRGVLRLNAQFQDNLARGLPNEWRCRAGAQVAAADTWRSRQISRGDNVATAWPVLSQRKDV